MRTHWQVVVILMASKRRKRENFTSGANECADLLEWNNWIRNSFYAETAVRGLVQYVTPEERADEKNKIDNR